MEERKYETSCGGERHKYVKGINCSVENCVYHDGKTECYAGEICVGPCDATCSSSTACATFKPKKY